MRLTVTDAIARLSSLFITVVADTLGHDWHARAHDDPIEAVAALAEPTRRALYEHVVASTEPSAATTPRRPRASAGSWRHSISIVSSRPGCSRPNTVGAAGGPVLARAGPPSSIAAPTRHRGLAPARRYERAADLMATALQRLPGGRGSKRPPGPRVNAARASGAEARRRAGRRLGRTRARAALLEVLRGAGYEPDDRRGRDGLPSELSI